MTSASGNRRWLIRLALALCIACSLLAAFLLYQLNGIVHGTLYGYGLQFSDDWAIPYWSAERLLYACLFAPSLIGGSVLVFDLLRSRGEKAPVVKQARNHVSRSRIASPAPRVVLKDNSAKIRCPKCKRILGKYLNMLDFSSGKARLVDVCPYCNHILVDTESAETDIIILEHEKPGQVH